MSDVERAKEVAQMSVQIIVDYFGERETWKESIVSMMKDALHDFLIELSHKFDNKQLELSQQFHETYHTDQSEDGSWAGFTVCGCDICKKKTVNERTEFLKTGYIFDTQAEALEYVITDGKERLAVIKKTFFDEIYRLVDERFGFHYDSTEI